MSNTSIDLLDDLSFSDELPASSVALQHCQKHIPKQPDILWAEQPRLKWHFKLYHLFTIPFLLFLSLIMLSPLYLSWVYGAAYLDYYRVVIIGAVAFYFAIPHHIIKYFKLKNTYYALTPEGLWELHDTKATRYNLSLLRNVIYVPEENHYGNLGFLYRTNGNWKNHSFKDIPRGRILHQAVMEQLELASQPTS